MTDDNSVHAFTDGACSGNPGPGGWAALLRYRKHEKLLSGGEERTTNNRMELTAVIAVLKSLKKPCTVHITTDSQYVQKGATEWLGNWIRNGWRTSAKKPVLNADLWQEFHSLQNNHRIVWHWVKGHAGHPENERVDEAARSAIPRHG